MIADDERDRALLAAHVGGDPDAFAQLARLHTGRLYAVALRTLGDREEAADAVQDALVSAYRRAETFRGDAKVSTWLHRVAVNACLDRLRRQAVRPTVPLSGDETVTTRDEVQDRERSLDVVAALARLPAEQRAAIVLVDLEGFSVAETAQILDVATGTVKSRCSRGRARLAVLLEHLREDVRNPADAPSVRPEAHDASAEPHDRPAEARDEPGGAA